MEERISDPPRAAGIDRIIEEERMAEKKSLVKNSIFNMIYKGFTLFPLITTSYISRVLLPAGVGRVGYANTIVA